MTTRLDVARYLARAIRVCGKTHKDIAREAGFETHNIISMMKKGDTKVPIARIPQLAAALEVDPVELLDLCLAAYQPEVHKVLADLGRGQCTCSSGA